MYLHLLNAEDLGFLPQEIGQFVVAGVEEAHPDPELAEQLLLVELHPQLRVAHHQVVVVVHEGPEALALQQRVEVVLLEVEQQRALLELVELLLQGVLGVEAQGELVGRAHQDHDVGYAVDVLVEADLVLQVLEIEAAGVGNLFSLQGFNLKDESLLERVVCPEDVSVEVVECSVLG